MRVILRYAAICFSIVLIATVIIVFFVNKEDGQFGSNNEQKAQKFAHQDTSNAQYNMNFNFDGDKSQLIDLMEGRAEFNVVYSGDSRFIAKILHPDGTLLTLLADVNGPYNQRQVVNIPETGVYLLDVSTTGEWSLSRK